MAASWKALRNLPNGGANFWSRPKWMVKVSLINLKIADFSKDVEFIPDICKRHAITSFV